MSVPKVLLLVNSPPGAQGVGELWLRDLCSAYPKGRLIRFSTLPPAAELVNGEWCGVPTATAEVRSSRFPLLSSAAVWRAFGARQSKLADRVAAFAREHRPDILWSVPSSPALISLTLEVMSRIGTPLVTSVLDPPSYFTRNLNLDMWTSNFVNRKFREVLVRSERVATVSEGMQSAIGKVTNAECCILRHGFPESEWRPPKKALCSQNEIRIGFAGSLYAKAEWRALLRAVRAAGGEVCGRRVQIVFVGRRPRFGVPTEPFVEFVGQRTARETLEAMSSVDLCYVPYWFSPSHADAATQSFPSKISAYAAAGVPIFVHAPSYSSPVAFLRRYPMGVFCDSRRPEDILATIGEFIQSDGLRVRAAEAIAAARAEELGRAAMLSNFARLIGVQLSSLSV